MTTDTNFADYAARLRDFIRRNSSETPPATPEKHESSFNDLALALFPLQLAHNPAYARFCERRGGTRVAGWRDIPAVPASAFKELELTSLPAAERTTVFHSSGTTEQKPSRHFHSAASLALYEASLRPWFRAHLLADGDKLPFVSLTPSRALAPHSSLVHMFATVGREFGQGEPLFAGVVDGGGAWSLDGEKVLAALREFSHTGQPIVLLGTAFNFVHLLDHLAGGTLLLPAGSRVLETGGYKGRSRALPKAELHALLTSRLGLPPSHIVCEYGMSELSSQAYDHVAGQAESAEGETRTFRFPPWARAQIISPETGREVGEGESGLLRIVDLANVHSVMAIQTEDLGTRRGGGFELLGRAPQAEPRGCSLQTMLAPIVNRKS